MIQARWNFARIPGLEAEKDLLRRNIREDRIPHSQLFLGDYGTATLGMALATARFILCEQKGDDACETCKACNSSAKWAHPHFHFSYPVVGGGLISREFLAEWRELLDQGPWFSPTDWFAHQSEDRKLGNINVAECQDIVQRLTYIAPEGQYKIMLIYGLEFLHKEGNRLLKLIEEPPDRTLFLLVAADAARVLPTVLSRCQTLRIRTFTDHEIREVLEAQSIATGEAASLIAYQADGNMGKAVELAGDQGQTFAGAFVTWMRHCFKSTGSDTIKQATSLGGLTREEQKSFLHYALHFIRQMVYAKVEMPELIRLPEEHKRSAIGMARQLDTERLEEMTELFEKTLWALGQNANMKIQFLHLSIQVHALFTNKVRYLSTIKHV